MSEAGAEAFPLFDINEGLRRREVGMANATKGADSEWAAAAGRVVAQLAASGAEFTTDEVWARTGSPSSGDPRALGPIILRASRAGAISRVGWKQSKRPECHARPVAIWKGESL